MRDVGDTARIKFGKILRHAREYTGLSREKLSRLAGVGHSTIQFTEEGKKFISMYNLDKLTKVIGNDVCDLKYEYCKAAIKDGNPINGLTALIYCMRVFLNLSGVEFDGIMMFTYRMVEAGHRPTERSTTPLTFIFNIEEYKLFELYDLSGSISFSWYSRVIDLAQSSVDYYNKMLSEGRTISYDGYCVYWV